MGWRTFLLNESYSQHKESIFISIYKFTRTHTQTYRPLTNWCQCQCCCSRWTLSDDDVDVFSLLSVSGECKPYLLYLLYLLLYWVAVSCKLDLLLLLSEEDRPRLINCLSAVGTVVCCLIIDLGRSDSDPLSNVIALWLSIAGCCFMYNCAMLCLACV